MLQISLRRRIALVACVASLLGGVAVLSANPSLLATTADGGLPVGGGGGEFGFTGGGVDIPSETVPPPVEDIDQLYPGLPFGLNAAVKEAQRLLKTKPACNQLITIGAVGDISSRSSARTDALSLLNGPIKIELISSVKPDDPSTPEDERKTVAEVGVRDASGRFMQRDGALRGSVVLVYSPVFDALDDGVVSDILLNPGQQIFQGTATPEIIKVLSILHELAHATGGNGHAAGDPDKPFNRLIYTSCLGFQIVNPAAQPPRAPGRPTPFNTLTQD
jgi:hypothetical protein